MSRSSFIAIILAAGLVLCCIPSILPFVLLSRTAITQRISLPILTRTELGDSHKQIPFSSASLSRTRYTAVSCTSIGSAESKNGTTTTTANKVFPDHLDSIRQAIDIIAIIESYGLHQFKRKTATLAMACCPFHDDKSPSLHIDSNRGRFKCFGCGAGGDVFSFVRDYANKVLYQGSGGNEVTYYQAVKRVCIEWMDGKDGGDFSHASSKSSVEKDMVRFRKERILLANSAAVEFYFKCLVEPWAGEARTYLKTRGISPSTVQSFRLGYAPDFFFGHRARSNTFGLGSLVSHLQSIGFSPLEIMEAGLAVRINSTSSTATDSPQVKNMTYASLMDRFRGRLIVPIVDRTGKNVVALGGRILPHSPQSSVTRQRTAAIFSPRSFSSSSTYRPAKYLNSPETLVFQKRYSLFGEDVAREYFLHLQSNNRSTLEASSLSSNDLVLVEGYMDAIALWNAGIRGSVASMGTALSRDQLIAAARIIQQTSSSVLSDGRVVLCLDNDSAGIAALERLCGNGILLEVEKISKIEFRIAVLPDGIKDPDEFIQNAVNSCNNAGILFHKQVIAVAEDWVKWFVRQIVACYDPNAQRGRRGSFGYILERVADHLAASMLPADRTRTAYEVAGSLARILAQETNSSCVSEALKSQLQSDLIELTTRIANKRESVRIRAEMISVNRTESNARTALNVMASGEDLSDVSGQHPRREIVSQNRPAIKSTRNFIFRLNSDGNSSSNSRIVFRSLPKRMARSRSFLSPRIQSRRDIVALTPHFSGFHFAHKSDEDWLKRSRSAPEFSKWPSKSDDAVYFNSNKYHGSQYLTEDAANAGYERDDSFNRDPSLIEKGIGSLLKPDTSRLILSAENQLLRILIRHGSARITLKNAINARNVIGITHDVEWSSDAKASLFEWLVGEAADVAFSTQSSTSIRKRVTGLLTCPPRAMPADSSSPIFKNVLNKLSNRSTELDYLFENECVDDVDLFIRDDRRAEREVQQYYNALLSASTSARFNAIQGAMENVLKDINSSLSNDKTQQPTMGVSPKDRDSQLRDRFLGLAEELRDVTETLHSLTTSAKIASARDLHDCSSKSMEINTSTSVSLQSELIFLLEEYAKHRHRSKFWPSLGMK